MRVNRIGILVVTLVMGMGPAAAAVETPASDTKPTGDEHLRTIAKIAENYREKLGEEGIGRLSSGMRQLITVGDRRKKLEAAANAVSRSRTASDIELGPRRSPRGQGNDPYAGEDLFTRFSGMTQSEPSVAWCGRNALIGWNDSGSFVASSYLSASPSGSLSFNGWGRSTDAGRTFTDMGTHVADPLPDGVETRDLFGDPVLGCTGPDTFYYASLADDDGKQGVLSGIAVSRSTDGGATFGGAVMAAAKPVSSHALDKEWMAVDPGPTDDPGDDVIHVSYTDFDLSRDSAACGTSRRTAIEYVRSADGGATWSEPLIIDEVCGTTAFVQGSQVEAGAGDDVHVAWERYTDSGDTRDIRIRRSADLGGTFDDAVVVTPVTPVGDGTVLQGNFRAFLDLQGLAVDRSKDIVYLSFQDGKARKKFDPLSDCAGEDAYCFGDAYVTSSTDGTTWSEPVRVNNDDPTLGIDQFFPHIDVDSRGGLWVAFHDRRHDRRNFLIDTYLGYSRNGGRAWFNHRLTRHGSSPVTGWQDEVVVDSYMGDYIAVATDATGRYPGAISVWGDNTLGDQNVRQRRLP